MPPLHFFLSLVLIAGLAETWPLAEILTWPWRWAGLAPILAGVWLNYGADRLIRERGTTIKPFEISTALITDGAFRTSRNPIYLGMILILIGEALLFGQLSPFFVCAAFAALMHFRFVLVEERILRETFGERFDAYCARTRRWL